MQQSDETARGIRYLRDIIQSGKILKLLEPQPVNQGYSYLLRICAFEKEWRFSLGRNQLNDLPATKSFHEPVLALAKALEFRFRNVDPNFFTTCSGRLLDVRIDWPPIPWMGQQGLIAASGLWVRITDLVTKELARCPIIATHQQEIFSDVRYILCGPNISRIRFVLSSTRELSRSIEMTPTYRKRSNTSGC